MRIRANGDLIAGEFARIMGINNKITKKASESEAVDAASDSVESDSENEAMDGSVTEDEIMDLLSAPSENESEDAALTQLDSAIDELSESNAEDAENNAEDAVEVKKEASFVGNKEKKVMYGLGKIAASLRLRGEGFAADVVESTARSIAGDIQKEAAQKRNVVDGLKKVASKLDRSGDKFAGDLVRVTIQKIIES